MKGSELLSSGPKEEQDVVLPTYIVELAKSGRAECKKCDSKIDHKTVRVGVIVDGQWGLTTRWQHLECTVFHKEIKLACELDGYQELDRDKKTLVEERLRASANEVDDDDIPINPDELVRKGWDSPMDPPVDLLMPLLAYQKEGLGWMVNQEQSASHGGILADEMGMGKTIQAISLMLSHRPNFSDFVQMREWTASDERHGNAGELPKARTLIVLPTVAIRQWQTEIARFTRNGALSVKVYHGSDRNTSAQDLTDIDVVLTSYKILEIEYRKATAGTKVTCRVCGKKFYPEKLRVHRRYFCGEDAQRTEAQALTQKKKQRIILPGGGRTVTAVQSDEEGESEEDEVAQQKRRNNQKKLEQQQKRSTNAKKNEKVVIKSKKHVQKKNPVDDGKEKAKISGKRVAAIAATNAAITNRRSVVSKVTTKTLRSASSPLSSGEEKDDGDDSSSSAGNRGRKCSLRGIKSPESTAKPRSKSKPKSVMAVNKKKGAALLPSSSQPKRVGGLDNNSSEDPVHRKSRRSLAQVVRNYCPGSDLDLVDSDAGGRSVDSGGEDIRGADSEGSVYGSDAASADQDGGDSEDSADSTEDVPSSDTDYVAKSGTRQGRKTPSDLSDKKQASAYTDIGKGQSVKSPRERVKQVPVAKKGVGMKRSHVESSADAEESSGSGDEGSAADQGEWSGQEEVEQDIQEAIAASALALKRSRQAPPTSVLHQLSWFRIILDEAHLIKDRSTSTAKAVFNLISVNKWCLTGTPLQNRVGELYSLVRFLRIDPYAFYYCRSKQCACKSLHYRFTNGLCDDCGHSAMQHYCHFNKHILNPIKRSGYVAEGRKAMLKLKQQVLDEILLRRTKTTRAEDIQLPPRVVRVRQERLDEKEEDFYQALYTQSQAQFNTYLQAGTVLNNYAHIFDILIRLRQAVDHPYLVIYSDTQTAPKADADNFLTNATADTEPAGADVIIKTEKGACDLCHEPLEDPVVAECGHAFCRSCIVDYIDTVAPTGSLASSLQSRSPALRCPDCDSPLTVQLSISPGGPNARNQGVTTQARRNIPQQDLVGLSTSSVWDPSKGLGRRSILDRVDLSLFQSSTKIEALMEELHRMQADDLGAKAIVFSQFVNMLDLINYRVQRGGIACVKLSGSMNLEQRDKAITAFKNDPSVKVMLISLKAGGVALNLTVASRIFLMDPWWNPAAEMQAIDRTHRIGQFKPIYATRFIIENTIEERILRLQEKKKLVFDGTVGGDAGSMSKLTVDDMRFLFN